MIVQTDIDRDWLHITWFEEGRNGRLLSDFKCEFVTDPEPAYRAEVWIPGRNHEAQGLITAKGIEYFIERIVTDLNGGRDDIQPAINAAQQYVIGRWIDTFHMLDNTDDVTLTLTLPGPMEFDIPTKFVDGMPDYNNMWSGATQIGHTLTFNEYGSRPRQAVYRIDGDSIVYTLTWDLSGADPSPNSPYAPKNLMGTNPEWDQRVRDARDRPGRNVPPSNEEAARETPA